MDFHYVNNSVGKWNISSIKDDEYIGETLSRGKSGNNGCERL